jgi:phytoene dehydrogenase-like protein
VTPVRIDPLAYYVFPDGLEIDYTTSLPRLLSMIKKIEPTDVEGFLKFMKLGAKIYNLSRETFFNHSPFEFPPDINIKVLKHFPLRYAWGNYARTIEAHFKSTYLQQLFNRYPTYVGSSPYKTPATLTVIPYIEFAYGGWFFRGGLYRIIEALTDIAEEKGVKIFTNSEVAEVIHTGKKVTGVRLVDGTKLSAEIVIMNGDASMVQGLLEGKNNSGLQLSDRSLSGIVFLVGISKTMHNIHHHSIVFSNSYTQEFAQLFEQRQFPDDPTVYVNAASRSDRSLVPGEGETLFIMRLRWITRTGITLALKKPGRQLCTV